MHIRIRAVYRHVELGRVGLPISPQFSFGTPPVQGGPLNRLIHEPTDRLPILVVALAPDCPSSLLLVHDEQITRANVLLSCAGFASIAPPYSLPNGHIAMDFASYNRSLLVASVEKTWRSRTRIGHDGESEICYSARDAQTSTSPLSVGEIVQLYRYRKAVINVICEPSDRVKILWDDILCWD